LKWTAFSGARDLAAHPPPRDCFRVQVEHVAAANLTADRSRRFCHRSRIVFALPLLGMIGEIAA
jgi:hypothetical protein